MFSLQLQSHAVLTTVIREASKVYDAKEIVRSNVKRPVAFVDTITHHHHSQRIKNLWYLPVVWHVGSNVRSLSPFTLDLHTNEELVFEAHTVMIIPPAPRGCSLQSEAEMLETMCQIGFSLNRDRRFVQAHCAFDRNY